MPEELNPEEEFELVSKSEMKREMHRFQKLGETLCTLKPSDWKTLPISEHLHSALEESLRIKKNEAKRRHMQYIGKLMREQDIDAIQAQLDLSNPSSDAYMRNMNILENWRTKLITSDDALNQFISEYPETDRQHLRNLIRNARKEVQAEPPKPAGAYKKLFQYLKTQYKPSNASS